MRRGARSARVAALAAGTAALVLLTGCTATTAPSAAPATTPAAATAPSTALPGAAAGLRPPSHVVVVVLENHGYSQIIGNRSAPYLNRLAATGALYTRSYAVTHPSQPNYLVLFAGSNLGVRGDSCPHSLRAANLGSQLRASGRSFAGYSEGLPATGWTGCGTGAYARRHAPWVNFTNLPGSVNRPFRLFPKRFSALPTVSFVIPNLDHDMHDGSVRAGDAWVRANLGRYATWARTHNSLLIVTFDEDDGSQANRIATIAYGAHVRRGRHATKVTHCRVLRTIEAAYRLPGLGCARSARPIRSMWRP